MNDRASTLLTGRRERLESALGRRLPTPAASPEGPITPERRAHLRSEAEDLYWNELEWEHITDEEALEEGPLPELTFPGLLAFVRGLLLHEVMPDSLSPADPQPKVVEDVLSFLARRVVELEDGLSDHEPTEEGRLEAELNMTNGLIDRVLYLFHALQPEDIARVEAEAQASA